MEQIYRPSFPALNLQQWAGSIYTWLTHPLLDPQKNGRVLMDPLMKLVTKVVGEPVLLFGHSSGGTVALEALVASPTSFVGGMIYEPALVLGSTDGLHLAGTGSSGIVRWAKDSNMRGNRKRMVSQAEPLGSSHR